MNPKQSELLNIIKNLQIPYEEKYSAVEEIAMHVAWRKIEADDISQVYQTVVEFWRSLGLNEIDRDDEGLFETKWRMFVWDYLASYLRVKNFSNIILL